MRPHLSYYKQYRLSSISRLAYGCSLCHYFPQQIVEIFMKVDYKNIQFLHRLSFKNMNKENALVRGHHKICLMFPYLDKYQL